MKKVLFVTALLCAALGAVSAQNRLPDLEAYFAAANQLDSPKWDFENRPFRGEEATDTARFGNLTGNLNYIDSYLEFALLTYYSAAEKPWAERGNAILPLNNPRMVDRQLGAMVVKEPAEIRFLDPSNTAAIGRYEGMIKYISDKNGVSRADMQDYLKQGIATVVDAEFNKIIFMVDTDTDGANVELIRQPNGYVLICDGYWGNPKKEEVRQFSASSINALLTVMNNSGNFKSSATETVQNNAALIPAVVLADTGTTDAVSGTIKKTLADFYLSPTTTRYNTIKDMHAFFMRRSWESQDPFFEIMNSSYFSVLVELNSPLADKVSSDARQEKYAMPSLTQTQIKALTVPR